MEEVKSILTSKTVWGVVITAVGALLSKYGMDGSSLTGMDGTIVEFIGMCFTIYGRIKAVKKIA